LNYSGASKITELEKVGGEELRKNKSKWKEVTEIALSATTKSNLRVEQLLARLPIGSTLSFYQAGTPANRAAYRVSGMKVVEAVGVVFTVELLSAAGAEEWGSTGSEVDVLITAPKDWGIVSALPATPKSGDRCTYQADAANGIYWDLVYDGEGSLPWKKIGGPPLLAIEEAERKTKSIVYQTAGAPSINYPLNGDYYVSWGSYDVRAAIAGDTGFIRVGYHSNGVLIKEAIGRLDANGAALFLFKRRHNERTKGQAAQARYKNDSEAAGETVFEGLFIELDPVRVG
jgi:hypothetical protein